ncbi:hypothetical protein C7R57_03290 [Macrococcoides caseolyticum subsp. caseolyticum]|uniref:phage tail protein n=1 Tax=Macrococcoides caseolyticum TaxID=69966 RepID=UPI000CD0F4CA|nr:phage tail protein [Macrococcus caseolyticus]PNZ72049.1 hypothetical protein CD152_08135 [Macrococcus caseolyticus]QPT47664.1 phage tail protein [Macrococcus caseolyticus]RAK47558.1 hypothetical protein C7R57_03290 [Macrococcus caseolyticus subsp. caseolyticus]HCD19393.1 hypothetical protein [Macrococcus caseolyticus]
MLIITDLKNNTHALLANKTIKKELNGDHTIELEVHQQKNNALNLNSISEMWTVTYKNIDYKIVYIDKIPKGNSFYLKLRGKPLFYDEFSTSVIHPRRNGSITFSEAFKLIFANTSFTPILEAQRTATTWDGFGNGLSRLDLFKKAIDKFNVEFEVVGSRVYLRDMIGNDTNFLYKYKLNASNISKSIDATSYYTHRKGFGNFKEGEEDYYNKSLLKRAYTSKLASIIGVREMSPPIIDGRIKDAAYMDKLLKESVDESLNVTVSATLHDLRKQGYAHGIPTVGDRTFLLDERIDLKQEIRVTGIEERYDEKDVLKDCNVDFGSQSIRKRYASKMSSAMKTVTDMMKGFVKLPFATLDVMAQEMIKKIQSVSTELVLDNGIFAIDKNNPNNIVGLNSAGWYISTDGGRTPRMVATAEGLVAESIVGKSLIGLNITSPGAKSYFHVNGGDAEFVDVSSGRKVSISPYGVFGYNDGGKVLFRADNTLVTSSALGTSVSNVYLGCAPGAEGRVVNIYGIPGDGEIDSYAYRPLRALAFKFPLKSNGYIGIDLDELRIMSDGLNDGGYKAVRASGYIGNHLDVNTQDNGTHLYLRPASGGRVKVTQLGTTDKFADFQARKIYGEVVSNSSEKLKTNIREWDINGIETVKAMKLYEYNYKEKLKNGDDTLNHGLIVERETPEHVKDDKGINIYEYVSTLTKAVQELISENESIKKELNDNHEKELLFYQQELAKAMSEKIVIQAMLDDALEELDQIKNGNQEVAE